MISTKSWLAKARGFAAFAVIGGPFGALVGVAWIVVGALWDGGLPATDEVVVFGAFVTTLGVIAGVGFASLLAVLGSRSTLDDLTPYKGAVWGAITGLITSVAFGAFVGPAYLVALSVSWPFYALCVGLGASIGWGSLSVAQRTFRGQLREPEEPHDLLGSIGQDVSRRNDG